MPLFARRRFYAFNRWLLRFASRGLGFNNWRTMEDSGELWVIQQLLPSLLKEQKLVMLDVGAHHGEYSRELLKVFPGATVHAFEPHPNTFADLQKEAVPGLNLHHCALGASAGRAELFDRKGQDGSVHASLSKGSIRTMYQGEVVVHDVQVMTLDHFMETQKIERVDFVKIDTEGFEMDVLQGASTALFQGRIGTIQFEFNSLHVSRRQFLNDFIERIPSHRLYRLLKDGMVALDLLPIIEREVFAYQNIVAIPREIAPLNS